MARESEHEKGATSSDSYYFDHFDGLSFILLLKSNFIDRPNPIQSISLLSCLVILAWPFCGSSCCSSLLGHWHSLLVGYGSSCNHWNPVAHVFKIATNIWKDLSHGPVLLVEQLPGAIRIAPNLPTKSGGKGQVCVLC